MTSYRRAAALAWLAAVILMAFPLCADGGGNVYAMFAGDRRLETEHADTAVSDTVISEADMPWPQNVRARIDRLLDDDMFTTSTVGLMVYDLTADSAIYKYNERQLMRPASTLKMIVAVAALDRLGHDYEYKTDLYVTGRIDSCMLSGDVWCEGGFDPAFSNSDLDVFADSIRQLGIDTIRGDLYADLSMKDADRLGEGWCWDDDNPVLSPLLVSRKDEFMERLMRKLRGAGIVVEGGLKEGRMPRGVKRLCRISRSVGAILPRMMKKSDNLYSESLFYHLAASSDSSSPATARQGRKMVNRIISKLGLKPSGYYIADGSGLSLYNYVSPELEVEFLKYAHGKESIRPYLLESMPVAGVDGTLDSRMRRGYAMGNVRAKTGTVTGVSALAGYCTAANGHILCFSIINMGIRHASSGRRFQDRVCEALCRP